MQALLAQGLPVRRVLQALLLQGLLAPRLLVALTLQPELGHLLASARSPTKEAEQLGPELRLELLGVLPVQQSQWSQSHHTRQSLIMCHHSLRRRRLSRLAPSCHKNQAFTDTGHFTCSKSRRCNNYEVDDDEPADA